jgi:hypothetical protein
MAAERTLLTRLAVAATAARYWRSPNPPTCVYSADGPTPNCPATADNVSASKPFWSIKVSDRSTTDAVDSLGRAM